MHRPAPGQLRAALVTRWQRLRTRTTPTRVSPAPASPPRPAPARTPPPGPQRPGVRRRPVAGRRGRARPGVRPAALAGAAGLAVAGVAAGALVTAASASTAVTGDLSGSLATPAAGALGPEVSVLAGMDHALETSRASRAATRGGPAGRDQAGAAAPHRSAAPVARASRAGSGPARAGSGTPGQAGGQHAPPRPAAVRTSCTSVAHIGDSTSVDLISPASLPDPAQRLSATYARVGVRHLRISASGGRSIVEEMPGQANGDVVARAWHDSGYRGCWVFALGTNDAADISAGSQVGMPARIERMMSDAHGDPVLWVNTRTELSAGPWSEAHERAWDDALHEALARYPNLRILNWAGVAQPGWFLPDGIHYNSAGCAARARAIADGLARAFPLHGRSPSRVVS